jgi:predicted TIM-barrel fold metal-dependent hydrolase
MSGAWDCHAHVFGPYHQYPLSEQRSYTPDEAHISDYQAVLSQLGFQHGVLVHPSAYGTDHSLLFQALKTSPNFRGVVVANVHTKLAFKSLRDKGVRGARFSCRSGSQTNFFGSASFQDLMDLSPTLSDAGLHAELWTDCQILSSIEPQLLNSPIDVVIDHMGGFDAMAGLNDPGFQSLLRLLNSGKIWVKLCIYRNLMHLENRNSGVPFLKELLRTNPSRLIWGTDWPHLNVKPQPKTQNLLDEFKTWTQDEDLIHQILVVNPQDLYA